MNSSLVEISAHELEVLTNIAHGRIVYAQAPHACEGLLASGLVKKEGGQVTLTREGRRHVARSRKAGDSGAA